MRGSTEQPWKFLRQLKNNTGGHLGLVGDSNEKEKSVNTVSKSWSGNIKGNPAIQGHTQTPPV